MVYIYTTESRFKMTSLSIFGGQNIYQEREFKDEEYIQIGSSHMDTTMKNFLIKMSIIGLSAVISQIGVTHAYISDGIKTTTVEVRIPFTAPKSNAEFYFNLIFQFNIVVHGLFVYIGLEAWMSLVENTVLISPALFKLEMKRLCAQYKSKSISQLQTYKWFKNLVMLSTDTDK